MTSSRPPWRAIPECLIGIVGLLLCFPVFVGCWVLVAMVSNGPPIIHSRFVTTRGESRTAWRFRTEGNMGDFLRRSGFQHYPARWSLVIGEIGLAELWNLR
jgi:hypothetical protein